MVTITFPNAETEKRALGHLAGRWSGHALSTGEHLVPEAALDALADQGIPYTVSGRASGEQEIAALKAKLERGAAQAARGELIDGRQVFEEIHRMSAKRREGSR